MLKRKYNLNPEDNIYTIIDIETMGLNTIEGSPIVSIGASTFTLKDRSFQLLGMFYTLMDWRKQVETYNLTIDPNTFNWHKSLDDVVQDHHLYDSSYSLDSYKAVSSLRDSILFFNGRAEEKGVNHFIVGNSPDFDQRLIEILSRKMGIENMGWSYWQNIDFRTLQTFIDFPREFREKVEKDAVEIHNKHFDVSDKNSPPAKKHIAVFDAIYESLLLGEVLLKLGDLYEKRDQRC